MNVFTQSVTKAYDLTDATIEIIIMLLVAFLLGWWFHYLWTKLRSRYDAVQYANIPDEFKNIHENDLKIVEGIGPKIEELLKDNGITTWSELANSDVEKLREILQKGGDRFKMHDPQTWSDQAKLAVEGKWVELQEYQDFLIGGKHM